ncbi:MAG: hypothetical protein ACE145_20920 [Terriglobia bacterium]
MKKATAMLAEEYEEKFLLKEIAAVDARRAAQRAEWTRDERRRRLRRAVALVMIFNFAVGAFGLAIGRFPTGPEFAACVFGAVGAAAILW